MPGWSTNGSPKTTRRKAIEFKLLGKSWVEFQEKDSVNWRFIPYKNACSIKHEKITELENVKGNLIHNMTSGKHRKYIFTKSTQIQNSNPVTRWFYSYCIGDNVNTDRWKFVGQFSGCLFPRRPKIIAPSLETDGLINYCVAYNLRINSWRKRKCT